MAEPHREGLNTSTINDDADVRTPIWLIQVTLYSVIIFIGGIGNGLICWNVFTNKQRRISEYLVANLAVTDLGTCLISIPFDFVERVTGDFPFGSILCYMVYPLQTGLMAVSVITLLCMSFERYRIVMKPFSWRMTGNMAKTCIVIAWAIPIIVITPYALVLRLDGKQCLEIWPQDWYVKVFTLSVFILFFVIPLTVIGTSYVLAGRQLQMELESFKSFAETESRTHAIFAQKRAMQKIKVTKMFVLAFVVFTICMFPNHVIWLWHDFGGGRTYAHFKEILIFSNILTYINSAIDPFIFRQISIRIGSTVRIPKLCVENIDCSCCGYCLIEYVRINSLIVAERQNAIRNKGRKNKRKGTIKLQVNSTLPEKETIVMHVTSV